MTALRPHVTCPVCGATRVPCKSTASGYVLVQHNKPGGNFWHRVRCATTGHAVSLDAVLAWVAEEEASAAKTVEHWEARVTEAQERLASARSYAAEQAVALAKIAAKARKAAA
jgi:hypothetical protein